MKGFLLSNAAQLATRMWTVAADGWQSLADGFVATTKNSIMMH
jgi:hypothetical protein